MLKYNFIGSRWDPLWVVFSSICRSINPDFVFLQCMHALIVNTIIFRFIKRNTQYRFTGILLYYMFAYLYFNMEILRESLASAVFLVSLKYYQQKRYLIYYLISAVAFLIHSSAIVLFVIPFFSMLKLNKWTVGLLICVFSVLFIFQEKINTLLALFYFNQRIESKAETYKDFNLNIFGTIINVVRFCILPIYLLYIGQKFLKYTYRFSFLILVMAGIGIVTIYIPIFARFNNYMTIIYVTFLTEFLNKLFRYRPIAMAKYLTVGFLFALISFVQLYPYFDDTSRYAMGTRRYNYWYPYYSIFNKEQDAKRERLRYGEYR
ncbi:MAG TPA: EpsG family protein [Legionellaceae bacterium]|nr:EpsG family protein [Legionellaceae bacterium]